MLNQMVVATRNKGKLREIEKILDIPQLRLLTMDEAGVQGEAAEDGATFFENARKKAAYVLERTNLPTVADDSGLEVEALGGAPGVFSARYAGEHATDAQRIKQLLHEMKEKENRRARFVCSICFLMSGGGRLPGDRSFAFEGMCSGEILYAAEGTGGFGYDPIFYLPDFGRTFSQMSLEEKNRISHRAKAFIALKRHLQILDGGPESR